MSTPSPLPQPDPKLRLALLALFVASGFAALVYQSIWTHYLGLMLGHAAYAQTLVLVMFMGGLAAGSWLVSRRTLRLRRLLGAYAAVEAAIGVLGALFHPVFVAFTAFGQDHALPALQPLGLADAWQWLGAALLIAPQTVLMGATFPLIAGGVLRAFPGRGATGALGGLYFTNGIGAAAGALVATFVLLPAVGMRGALLVAALLNLLLAAGTAHIGRRLGEAALPPPAPAPAAAAVDPAALRRALLAATFCSSAASFGYEIGWVRLLNLALGTTLHGFELMLASFVAGLALGGLWVQRRGERIADGVRYAGYVQVAMGVAALLSVPLLAGSYAWVGWWVEALARSGPGYTLYQWATALTAIAIMVPAAFFAGMTLPLFTAALLRAGADERAVGQVYAANTLGAIVGVGLFVHLLVPRLGVGLGLLVAAAVDVAVGLALLRRLSPGRWRGGPAAAAIASLATLALVLRWGMPDPRVQAQGVFRTGHHPEALGTLDFYRDGATATVSVRTVPAATIIATNGKPDAGLAPADRPPSPDESTMLIAAALPLAAHPAPLRVGVIGWGSGLTTHALLGSHVPERVDTIEIEPAMWEGAKVFLPRNRRAYEDPRSHVHFDDARKFMATSGERFDVLVSEPSNPWVSGVSSLFTREFYALARRHLQPEGVLLQWVQVYEISDRLLAEIVAALLAEFPASEAYQSNSGDLVLLARRAPGPPLGALPWAEPALAAELRRVNLGSPADLQARRLAGPRVLAEFVRQQGVVPHTDYWPTVALAAPRERFSRSSAELLTQLLVAGVPALQVLDCRQPVAADAALFQAPVRDLAGVHRQVGQLLAQAMLEGRRSPLLLAQTPESVARLDALLAQRAGVVPYDEALALGHLQDLAAATLPAVDERTLQALWDPERWRAAPWRPGPAVQAQLRLFAAMARRQWAAAHDAAAELMAQAATPLPPEVADATIVLGQLAAAASGEAARIAAWEGPWAGRVRGGPLRQVSAFVSGWVRRQPVCAAVPG